MGRQQRGRREDGASRLARWRQSWVLALRLARRDVLAHRGRSLLIVVLVAAPVLLIAGLATAVSTDEVSARESLPVRLGRAQAQLTPASSSPIEQLPDGVTYNETGKEHRPFGGHEAGAEWTDAQLTALTGGRLVRAEFPTLFTAQDNRLTRLYALAMAAEDLPDSGLATLAGGRWPSAADEVLVTDSGVRKGLPAQGSVAVRQDDGVTERTVRVVGTASARDGEFRSLDLVSVNRTGAEPGTGAWLLLRDRPVTWAEVKDWNTYGLLVVSRAVVEDPPAIWQQPADLVQQRARNNVAEAAFVVLITLGLLLETSLLAGPAFAVSAVRRRRTLAQIACNGAEGAQLRRTVLAEALVLGGCAAVGGAALGAVGGWAALRLGNRLDLFASSGPLDLPWPALLGLVAAATIAALVAAFLPALGVGRIAIADVLAGRERSRPVRAGTPAVGLSFVLTAAAALVAMTTLGQAGGTSRLHGLAAAALVIGVLLLVPTLLGVLGRWAPWLPLTLRLPVRDATRQRGRSASAVAAVVATVATLTILSVANASNDARSRATYSTDRVAGHGYVDQQWTDSPSALTADEIRRQHPDWVVIRHEKLGFLDVDSGREPERVAVVPPGCSAKMSLGIEGSEADYERCMDDYVNGTMQTVGQDAVAGSAASAAVRAALARGVLAVSDDGLVVDGHVTLALSRGPGGPGGRVDRVLQVEALVVSRAELHAAARMRVPAPTATGETKYSWSPPDGLITAETAAALKLPTSLDYFQIIDPSGPISRRDQAAINERAIDLMLVERGYQSDLRLLLAGSLGVAGALVLIAALVATALAQAESRADLATLAALGGSPGLRRRLAAGQALVVAGLGSILGFAAGLLPGIAFALAFTSWGGLDPATGERIGSPDGLVVVPWAPLLAVLVGVPLLAALLAAAAVWRSPPLTRRLT